MKEEFLEQRDDAVQLLQISNRHNALVFLGVRALHSHLGRAVPRLVLENSFDPRLKLLQKLQDLEKSTRVILHGGYVFPADDQRPAPVRVVRDTFVPVVVGA